MVMLPQLGEIRDRFDVYRRLNGQVADVPGAGGSRPPVVKTFLLEHVRPTSERPATDPARILQGMGLETHPVDDTFLAVIGPDDSDKGKGEPGRKLLGYLETFEPRFFAFYTTEKSADAKRIVGQWLDSPELDFCWFNSRLLQRFWDEDVSLRGDRLYGKLVFKHKSVFEMPSEPSDEAGVIPAAGEFEDDDRPGRERRNARFEMGDRIGEIRDSLAQLQKHYSPLHALSSLRFPSRTGRGGHDLYQDGRVTNRTESFEEHRNVVRHFWRCYRSVLDATEQAAWQSGQDSVRLSGQTSRGVPLIIRFGEELSRETFDCLLQRAFRKNDRYFRLWGQPIRLGPTKVHVYGADRHLWQPINLELTSKGLTAILPQDTCGNTFHRLVTSIQHYVCPQIDAWLGDREFASLATFGEMREGEVE